MKWWLYNRFRYLDSKYVTGTSMTNRITIRAHQKANVFLTSYVNMYGHVYFNAAVAEHRMTRGQEYEFEWPASGAEDPVIGINDADLLTSLGDLSPLMVELIDVSGAPHISTLKLGDGSADYSNRSLNSVTLGNNKLLRTLDMRNCPNLTVGPDVSGCTNIEEIYCEGTSITGIKLPAGGILKKLHLPGTIVSLQIINQPQLTDFVLPSYNQITTLRLENAGVVGNLAMDILNAMPENSRVRVLDIHFEAESSDALKAFLNRLDSMRGLDENGNNTDYAQVSGSVHTTEVSPSLLAIIEAAKEKYPSLTITYDSVGKYMTTQFVERTLSGEYVNDRVTVIGANAFIMCTQLTSVEFPAVKTIGNHGLAYIYGLKNISLPNVETLGDYALSGIPGPKYVVLPKFKTSGREAMTFSATEIVDLPQATSIGQGAFGTSKTVKALILRNTNQVCTLNNVLAWGNSMSTSGTGCIYVPRTMADGSDGVAAYEAATNWSSYAGRIRAIEDYTVDGTLMGEIDESKI